MNNPTIISLGGSLVVPQEIDTVFLASFKKLVEREIKKGKEFIIIVGGGKICRKYQAAAKELGANTARELDWVGIYATRLNANFFRIIMGDLAHEEVISDPRIVTPISKPLAVGAGWKPGWSTDFDAVEMAKTMGAKKIVNLSNIDYVYDKDPKKFPDAVKIEKTNWREFRKILPTKWSPGVNAPFDPVAAKRAEELGLEVAIMNGADLDNFSNYLAGKEFKGTIICSR